MTGPDPKEDPTLLADLDGKVADEQFLDGDAGDLDVQIVEDDETGDDDLDGPDDDPDDPDPEPHEADGGDDDAAEDDLRGYSSKVRDRIMRERRIRERDVEAVNNHLAQERTRRLEAEKIAAASTAANLDNQLAKAEAELEKAIEEGDSKTQAKLHSTLADIRAKRGQVDEITRRIEAETKAAPARSDNPELDAWKKRNAWFSDPSKQSARMLAIGVDRELAAQGLDPKSRAYFEAMDERMAKAFPELYRGRKQGRSGQQQQRRRNPGRGDVLPPASSAATGKQPNRVVLNQQDVRTMKRFGLDPQNKDHVRAFAAERRASLARDNRR